MITPLRTAAALVALTIAACTSSPVTLVALPAPVVSAQAGDESSITVRVRGVKLPVYLESFPVVIGRSGNTLDVARNVEWAERLPDGVARVLRDALSQRLGASRVLMGGERRSPDADLATEFFALAPEDGVLVLDARWSLFCAATSYSHGGRTRLKVPLETATAPAVAAATTEALNRFADLLAAGMRCGPSA